MRLGILLGAGLTAFLIDQISKYAVIHAMGLARRMEIELLPPLLTFRYGENRGINFGLFGDGDASARWVLIALALVISAALVLWVRRAPDPWHKQMFAGLVVGGALANVADRLIYGYVLDFMNMSCCGIHNPYVFNLADVFIFAGAAGLVLFDIGNEGKKAP